VDFPQEAIQRAFLGTACGLGSSTATNWAKSCSRLGGANLWMSASTTVSDCFEVAWMSLKGQQATLTDASRVFVLIVRNREAS